jgi:hypothetical protein
MHCKGSALTGGKIDRSGELVHELHGNQIQFEQVDGQEGHDGRQARNGKHATDKADGQAPRQLLNRDACPEKE